MGLWSSIKGVANSIAQAATPKEEHVQEPIQIMLVDGKQKTRKEQLQAMVNGEDDTDSVKRTKRGLESVTDGSLLRRSEGPDEHGFDARDSATYANRFGRDAKEYRQRTIPSDGTLLSTDRGRLNYRSDFELQPYHEIERQRNHALGAEQEEVRRANRVIQEEAQRNFNRDMSAQERETNLAISRSQVSANRRQFVQELKGRARSASKYLNPLGYIDTARQELSTPGGRAIVKGAGKAARMVWGLGNTVAYDAQGNRLTDHPDLVMTGGGGHPDRIMARRSTRSGRDSFGVGTYGSYPSGLGSPGGSFQSGLGTPNNNAFNVGGGGSSFDWNIGGRPSIGSRRTRNARRQGNQWDIRL